MKLSDNKVEIVKRGNKVVFQDGERLVKVFNSEKPAADVFNEALNTARVQAAGLRTPEILEVSQIEDGEFAGSWALATRFIPGKTLYQAATDDPDNIDTYLEKFIELQKETQSFDAPLLNRQKDKLARMIKACTAIDPTVRYDLEMRVDGMHSGIKVCHGDLIPSNIILSEEDGQLYLCDWAHVTAGIPVVDAAMTYMLFNLEHPDYAAKYLDMYSKATDTPKQLIHYWLPVVAAAELSRNRKLNDEFLLGWIQVGDFE